MRKDRRFLFIISCLLVSFVFFGYYMTQQDYSYKEPEETGDGWKTASLSNVGIDKTPIIEGMKSLIKLDEHPIHSILIVKNGKLVFEEYFNGNDIIFNCAGEIELKQKEFDKDTLHCQTSVTKSITSTLLGIAIDQGKIPDINEKMLSYYPNYQNICIEKENITLEHMLSMSSGIPWDESYSYDDPRNSLYQQLHCEDPVKYLFEQPVTNSPGSYFIYNSGTTNVLGDIIKDCSGMTLVEFAEQYLFKPLGVSDFYWIGFPFAKDIAIASSSLYLRPRDMVKIGQLYLQGGVWNGLQIVSEDWITESTCESIMVPVSENPIPILVHSYGYQWWRGTFDNGDTDTFFAAGHGGQFIFVLPEHDMVIVFTGEHFEGNYQGFYNIINDVILNAIL
jgi:CubicO group peptidase (beta-lactamase class C family)